MLCSMIRLKKAVIPRSPATKNLLVNFFHAYSAQKQILRLGSG